MCMEGLEPQLDRISGNCSCARYILPCIQFYAGIPEGRVRCPDDWVGGYKIVSEIFDHNVWCTQFYVRIPGSSWRAAQRLDLIRNLEITIAPLHLHNSAEIYPWPGIPNVGNKHIPLISLSVHVFTFLEEFETDNIPWNNSIRYAFSTADIFNGCRSGRQVQKS